MNKFNRFIAGLLGVAMALNLFVGGSVAPASADATSDLIASLTAQLQNLQAQLLALTGGGSVGTGYTFNTNLTIGSTGADVVALQDVLVAQNYLTMPAGVAKGYFGALTRAAVARWQAANGISPAVGYFGIISRTKANSMGGPIVLPPPGTQPLPQPTGSGLVVTAGTQPANTLAPASAARVPFTKVTLTAGAGDVTVNSFTIQRTGLAQDENFGGVVLLDEMGTQMG